MVTVALCLLLTAAPTEAGRDVSLLPSSVAPATSFDALPAPAKVTDDKRVQRFLGALAGGVVGMGAGFALIGAGDLFGPCGGFGFSCINGFQGVAGAVTPLLGLVGAFAGYQLLGGEGSLLTTTAAMAPAVVIALMLLAIGIETGASTALDFAPFAIGAGAFLVGGAALSLHLRQEQLSSLGGAASWGSASPGRATLTSLVSLLTVGSSAFLTTLVGAALIYPLGAVGMALAVTTGLVLAAASAFTIYGVHRAMSGRGSIAAVLAGLGVALAASGASLGLIFANSSGPGGVFSALPMTSSIILMTQLAIISGTFFPMLALEWSHTSAVQSSLPPISFGAAPLRDGGLVSAAVRF